MKKLKEMLSLTIALGCASAMAADRPADTARTPSAATQGQVTPDANNTGMNERDKSGMTQTPQKQAGSTKDRKLLAAVRRAVVNEKTLSSSANNVKIIVENGVVTLRGPVRSGDEKAKVEELARHVTGVSRVDNQLDIKTE